MLKKRNLSKAEALKSACEANGFTYDSTTSKRNGTIILVNDHGKKIELNSKLKIVNRDNDDNLNTLSLRDFGSKTTFAIPIHNTKTESNLIEKSITAADSCGASRLSLSALRKKYAKKKHNALVKGKERIK